MHPTGGQAHVQIINRSVAENAPLGSTGVQRAAAAAVAVFTDELQEVNSEIESHMRSKQRLTFHEGWSRAINT